MQTLEPAESGRALSLYHLLDPEVLANPYPLYRRLRTEDPVHWDPFLHAWVVTRYADVIAVLQRFSANRTPTPEQVSAMGMEALSPIARMMVLSGLKPAKKRAVSVHSAPERSLG